MTDLDRLHGGVSSLTLAARLSDGRDGGRPIVVKVAPPGLPPVRNRDALRRARVLHDGSLAGYAAAKAAVVHWTRHLAAEIAADGIRVNMFAPGSR